MCDFVLDRLNPFKGAKWIAGQFRPSMPSMKALEPPKTPAVDDPEATAAASMEARLRRRRAGAAANVLTSPLGIPAGTSTTLGGGA